MAPIGKLKRSVSAIVSIFLVLLLGAGIFLPSVAHGYDQFLPTQVVQQMPMDGDPDLPGEFTGDRMINAEMEIPDGIRLLIEISSMLGYLIL